MGEEEGENGRHREADLDAFAQAAPAVGAAKARPAASRKRAR